MKPNPDIALIYHYDLARALAGEVVDWQAIPVNVQAGREGGDLCRAAADFGKRRDLFAMPAPTAAVCHVCGDKLRASFGAPAEPICDACYHERVDIAVPVSPVTVEQPAVDPRPDTASPPAAVSAAEPDKLRARIAGIVEAGYEQMMRRHWPEGVPTLKHEGHTPDDLKRILSAVRLVESLVGAGWHPDDSPDPRSAKAIRRALDAWAGRDPGTAWFAASLIATFEQCRNADSTFEDLVSQFTIEQADRLHDAAQGITP